jgi:hypothetical protein
LKNLFTQLRDTIKAAHTKARLNADRPGMSPLMVGLYARAKFTFAERKYLAGSRPHFRVVARENLKRPDGSPVWRWVESTVDGVKAWVKASVQLIVITALNWGKTYPYSSKRQALRFA